MKNLDKEIWSRRLELPHSPDYDPCHEFDLEHEFGPRPDRESDHDPDLDMNMDFPDADDVDSVLDALLDEELQRQEDRWLSEETQRRLRQAETP